MKCTRKKKTCFPLSLFVVSCHSLSVNNKGFTDEIHHPHLVICLLEKCIFHVNAPPPLDGAGEISTKMADMRYACICRTPKSWLVAQGHCFFFIDWFGHCSYFCVNHRVQSHDCRHRFRPPSTVRPSANSCCFTAHSRGIADEVHGVSCQKWTAASWGSHPTGTLAHSKSVFLIITIFPLDIELFLTRTSINEYLVNCSRLAIQMKETSDVACWTCTYLRWYWTKSCVDSFDWRSPILRITQT